MRVKKVASFCAAHRARVQSDSSRAPQVIRPPLKKKALFPKKRMSGSAIAIAWCCIDATLIGCCVTRGGQPRLRIQFHGTHRGPLPK
jgi:hypothetical protein